MLLKRLKESEELGLIDVDRPGSGKANSYRLIKKVNEIKADSLISPQELAKKINEQCNQTKPAQNENRQNSYIINNNLNKPDQIVQPGI